MFDSIEVKLQVIFYDVSGETISSSELIPCKYIADSNVESLFRVYVPSTATRLKVLAVPIDRKQRKCLTLISHLKISDVSTCVSQIECEGNSPLYILYTLYILYLYMSEIVFPLYSFCLHTSMPLLVSRSGNL